MRFLIDEFLLLFFLLPPTALLLLFMKKKSRETYYPFVKIFNAKSIEKNSFKSFFMRMARILILLSSLASLIIFLAKPALSSDRTDHLLLFIDYTPHLGVSRLEINQIIDSLLKENDYSNVHLIINNKQVKYPLQELFVQRKELIPKTTVIENVSKQIQKLKSKSVKSVFLTDRTFERFNLETDVIVRRNPPKVLITGISSEITLYSMIDSPIEVAFKDKDDNIYKKSAKLVKGENNVKLPDRKIISINCVYDSIYLEKEISPVLNRVCDKTKDEHVRRVLRALDIEEDSQAKIKISFKSDIEKGIVFSKENEYSAKKSAFLAADERFRNSIKDMNKTIEYTALCEVPGTPLIMTKSGERIASKTGGVFYIALPLDTSKSNFVFTPSFVALVKKMLDGLSGEEFVPHEQLEYRKNLADEPECFISGYEPPKEKDVSFGFLLLSIIFFIALMLA
ncbi:MAG: hypothetical protein PHW02_05355 [bacterium]|nr:hypothetical protein [bacterium]